MPLITAPETRKIVDDFAREIQRKKTTGPKPSKAVIHFRNEKIHQVEREVFLVPLDLLRYRAENGRIASLVLDYQKVNGPLDERDASAQVLLEQFLAAKDPEKTAVLTKSIEHTGQNEPAVITADGFLINGNRRRMVLGRLREENPGKAEYQTMKVVILPGKGDSGGPPTLIEIERLENRYQLQSEGKAEYYGFDRALSIKRKMALGFSLEEQLRDDPMYANVSEKAMAQAIREVKKELLEPLECVDRYLQSFNRDELYASISTGLGDSEGRWQAFIDYSNAYHRYFQNPKWMLEKGVPEDDVGGLEDAAFKIIRLRQLKGLPKVHAVMRKLPALAAVKDSRKELLKLSAEVDSALPRKESVDAAGNPLTPDAADRKWVDHFQAPVINRVKKALTIQESNQETETPITLLEAALRKLNHDQMLVRNILTEDFPKARRLVVEIQQKGEDIERELYHYEKKADSLPKKKKVAEGGR